MTTGAGKLLCTACGRTYEFKNKLHCPLHKQSVLENDHTWYDSGL